MDCYECEGGLRDEGMGGLWGCKQTLADGE